MMSELSKQTCLSGRPRDANDAQKADAQAFIGRWAHSSGARRRTMDSLASCVSSRNPDAKARADRARNPAWIGDITNKVRTGDLLLFSSKHSTSYITKFFTRSRWDHIGIVVKPSPTRAYIVEWGGGLFACELVERLNEYAEWDAMELVLRHLNLKADRRAVEERIEKFVDMLFREKLGQNRGVPLGKP